MTKDEYWQAHLNKNPSFKDENKKIQISVSSLKKLMMEAYDKGYENAESQDSFVNDLLKDVDFNKLNVKK